MKMICSLMQVKPVSFWYCDEFCTNAAYWTVLGQNEVFMVDVWLHRGSLNSVKSTKSTQQLHRSADHILYAEKTNPVQLTSQFFYMSYF